MQKLINRFFEMTKKVSFGSTLLEFFLNFGQTAKISIRIQSQHVPHCSKNEVFKYRFLQQVRLAFLQ